MHSPTIVVRITRNSCDALLLIVRRPGDHWVASNRKCNSGHDSKQAGRLGWSAGQTGGSAGIDSAQGLILIPGITNPTQGKWLWLVD